MRNRETLNRRLEQLDHILINLQRIINTQEPIEVYKNNISKAQEVIEDIRTIVEREPMSPQELNSTLK